MARSTDPRPAADPRAAIEARSGVARPPVQTIRPTGGPLGWTDGPRGGRTGAAGLPVAVTGPRHIVTQVGAFVEASLGWQVTDGDHLPPRVLLAAVDGAPAASSPERSDDLPTVLLVGPDDPPLAAAHQAQEARAVLAWPGQHDRLQTVVDAIVDGGADPVVPHARPLAVAGSAGGVGTTTVALSIAAWMAWEGGRVLAVVAGRGPVAGVDRVAPAVLAGHRGWPAAVPVADVAGLRVVAATGPVREVEVPRGVRVVVDHGVVDSVGARVGMDGETVGEGTPDVLVVRRDGAGRAAVEAHPAAVVVVVDTGPRTLRDLAAVAGGRPLVVVPYSARAVRAHDRGRVPGSLPRTVLDPLRGLAEAGMH